MATRKQKEIAWKKAKPIQGKNPNLWRRDSSGNKIYKPAYGKEGKQSWQVDHKRPKSKGGTNRSNNLQALQTKENRRKGAKYPYKKR